MTTIFRDRTGRDIRVGDLLRTHHFTVGKRKYWQYFLVFRLEGHWRAAHPDQIPTRGLSLDSSVGLRLVASDPTCEIIAGYACQGNELGYEDRCRVSETT